MRSMKMVVLASLAAIAFALPPGPAAQAQSTASATRTTPQAFPVDASAQQRIGRRATTIRIYGRTLPPTATRTCTSWYEQEYRPSGTVIVPRMRCHWISG